MKPIKSLTLAAVIASVSVVSAFAEEFTKGTVKKVTAEEFQRAQEIIREE